jgi:hypothetical protein
MGNKQIEINQHKKDKVKSMEQEEGGKYENPSRIC